MTAIITEVSRDEVEVLLEVMTKKLGSVSKITPNDVEDGYEIAFSFGQVEKIYTIRSRKDYLALFNEFSRQYHVEKITRSCEKSISHNYNTHKVSTMLSVTVENGENKSEEEIKAIGKAVYQQARAMTEEEIKEIQLALAPIGK